MKRSDATAALSWANNTRATADTRITATEFRVLCVIAGGCRTRSEIAAAASCGESTIPRAVRRLEKIGALERTPDPGKANNYVVLVRPDTGTSVDTGVATSRAADEIGVAKPKWRGAKPDTPSPVLSTGAPIRNAGARATTKQITTSTSEDNPERPEGVWEIVMPGGPGELNIDWVIGDVERKFANERGYLNGSCDELFGQFIDHCATRGPRQSPAWRSEWKKWVRNQIRFDAERAQQLETQNVQRPRAAAAGRPDNIATRILMRDILDDPSDNDGRMDSLTGK